MEEEYLDRMGISCDSRGNTELLFLVQIGILQKIGMIGYLILKMQK
jgi:hypothetical protein